MKKEPEWLSGFLDSLRLFFLEMVKIPVFVLKEIRIIRSQRLFNALVLVYPLLAMASIAIVISGTTGLDVSTGTLPQAKIPLGVFFQPSDNFDPQTTRNEFAAFEYLQIQEFESQKHLLDAISSSRVRLGIEIIPPKNEFSPIETIFYYDNSNFIAASTIVGQMKTVVQNISYKKSGETLSAILSDINSIQSTLNQQAQKIEGILLAFDEASLEIEEIQGKLSGINLEDVSSRLDEFKEFYAEGKAGIAATISDINSVKAKISKHRTTVQELREQTVEVKGISGSALLTLSEAVQELNDANQTELALQVQSVHDLLSEQATQLDEINSSLTEAETDLDDTEQKMVTAENNLLLADSRLDSANQSILVLDENISELESLLGQTKTVLSESIASREVLRQDLVNAKGLLDELSAKLSGLKNYSPQVLSNPLKVSLTPLYEFSRVTALVPFTVAFVLLLTCLLLASTSMINEYRGGIVFRLKSSPTRFSTWLLGKITGQVIVAVFEATLVFLVAIAVFGSPFPQNPLEVLLAVVLSALAFVSIGIFITNFMKTISNSIFTSLLLIVPMVFLSGMIVPIEFMPPLIDVVARYMPFTAAIDLIQGTYLRGALVTEMFFTLIPLIVVTVFCIVLTYFFMKKK